MHFHFPHPVSFLHTRILHTHTLLLTHTPSLSTIYTFTSYKRSISTQVHFHFPHTFTFHTNTTHFQHTYFPHEYTFTFYTNILSLSTHLYFLNIYAHSKPTLVHFLHTFTSYTDTYSLSIYIHFLFKKLIYLF